MEKEVFLSVIKKLKDNLSSLNNELEKITIKQSLNRLLINCDNYLSLAKIDLDVLSTIDDEIISSEDKEKIKNVIKKANFLLQKCSDIDISNQKQYLDVMEALKKLYTFFVNKKQSYRDSDKENIVSKINSINSFLSSFNEKGFIKICEEFDSFDKFYLFLRENELSSLEINAVLNDLFKFNLKYYKSFESENKLEKQTKTLTDEEKEIYNKASLLLKKYSSEVKDIIKEKDVNRKLAFYIDAFDEGIDIDIPLEFLKKIFLYKLNKNISDLEKSFNINTFTIVDNENNIHIIINETKEIIDNFNKILEINKELSVDDKFANYDLIFLNNVEKEILSDFFDDEQEKKKISIIFNEIVKGNNENVKKVDSNLYIKSKKFDDESGVLVGYIPLSNNIILVVSVSSLEKGYSCIQNKYESNKAIIDFFKQHSEVAELKDSLIKNFSIGNTELNDLIYDNKRKGGLK